MVERALSLSAPATLAGLRRQIDGSALASWLLAVALVVYLGARQGGFDTVISSQVAILAWWLILLLLAGGLVRARITRSGWAAFALLAGYAVWTTLSLTWTQSSEATMVDVSQMLLYVALMGLALLVQGRRAVRHMLHGAAVGIVAIAVLAVLSRLRFEWFAVPAVASNLGGTASKRLSYPIDYWNGLAALMAIGIPLLLYGATGARTLAGRAAAAGALPLLALCAFLTASRGGVIEVAVGLVIFLLLAPDRLSKLGFAAIAGAGSVLLIAAAEQRGAIRDGARSALAAHQGNELIAITIVVAIGVAMLAAAAVLVERHVARPRALVLSRRRMTQVSVAGALVLIVAFVGASGPGFLSRKWTQFKSAGDVQTSSANAFSRLQSSSGEGRYQLWQTALHTANAKPLTGTGANTFQFVWLAHGTIPGAFVTDAHSLYVQALGDLGYPGFLLIVGFVLWVLGVGVWRVIRSRDPAHRLLLAAATASALAFAFSAAIDWIWFIPVLPICFFVCAAAIFSRDGEITDAAAPRSLPRAARYGARFALTAVCIAAIVVIALPMAATQQLRASQAQAGIGNLSLALADAHEAVALQPYAAAGYLQEALVQEQDGALPAALADAQAALKRQVVNWQIWLVVSRLELRSGHPNAAIADEQHARWLNPNNFPS